MKTNIKSERVKAEMNQEELAEVLGVTQSAVSSWEVGRTEPELEVLCEMSRLFNCTVDYLLCMKEERF